MALHKQTSDETVFLDEVVPEVETEVERQLDAMLRLDDRGDLNFSDADYPLAACAAALRVLTKYGSSRMENDHISCLTEPLKLPWFETFPIRREARCRPMTITSSNWNSSR